MTPNVSYFLDAKDRTRNKRLAKNKTKLQKKNRLKRKHEQLKADETAAKKARNKKMMAVYKSGMNMEDTVEEQGEQQPPGIQRKKAPAVCPYCGKKGHSTTRSTKCLHYKAAGQPAGGAPTAALQVPVATDELLNADDEADDMEVFDGMPLTDGAPDADGTTGVL
jgi:hypothetical protein